MVPDLMTRLYGSSDLFPDHSSQSFRPFQSINYIASHDGFTLYDLVAYNDKHNEANGQGNQDGPNEFSSNHGWEGDADASQSVRDLRKRQVKNFCCLLMLSAGTPMFRMGDEFMQTQGGNNNPYNQDNEASWLDWRQRDENGDMLRFFRQMIAFRKSNPALGRSTFWRDDVSWFGTADPEVDMSVESQVVAYWLRPKASSELEIYVMVNGSEHSCEFAIHADAKVDWTRVVDTSLPSPSDIVFPDSQVCIEQHRYRVNQRSVVVLTRSPTVASQA